MKFLLKIFFAFALGLGLLNAADFLMPDQAFKPYAKVNDEIQIEAGVTIAKDIYLYEDKLKIELVDAKGLSIENIQKPATTKHSGDNVYLKSPNFIVTLQKDASVSGLQDVKLKISYQGCSEQGLCYEPSSKIFNLKIDTSKFSANTAKSVEKTAEKNVKSETDSIADTIKSSSFLVVLATFFGFGVLLSLTPCVFPMIPIISGVIISQGEGLTTRKAFALSLVYVLAMAIAYTIAGVLAGLFGSNLQAALQTPWVVYSFAGVFVALAASMFGFYELKLPDALVTKVSSNSNRNGFAGVAIMGFLSALIVGPCVAAPLAGALVYIGQTGDALLGGAALFSMSIGMGILLILVGVSAGKFMPKPGPWMVMVNEIFGALMLGVAIWMLEKVLPSSITILMYAIVGLGFSVHFGAFDKEGHSFKRTVSLMLFIYSLALFISVLAGAPSIKQPLGFLKSQAAGTVFSANEKKLTFTKVTSLEELNALLQKNKGKKIMLDFAADWCTACKELEEVTFADPNIREKLSEFVLIRADVTANGAKEKALSKAYGVFGPPVILFFDKDLHVKKSKTIVGFIEPQEFLAHLNAL
ncbi:protein-disulfide reductase DsbD [Sulfurimonas autotrophica]|uniref:Cytochrome c biogenesis protein transmembrane region n=1 Tax=Sulfurimonas autotrophica (strain ATCC BAA-671 / DSM 16294 / JCM 11897 / OK10) TaxID=563040 RepID=E0US13_SULAO|nr:protein-disulfide reductase DsbD [Sulfurimonas autotrophica]ADN09036.1 cytochrome c biogenesis protein transmembrane region [Sulfurimonas autotrophica DSM 16294]